MERPFSYTSMHVTKWNGEIMQVRVRELRQSEIALLDEFLYHAIFIPDGVQAPPRDIVNHPDLQIYIADFGQADDICYVAEVDSQVVGAAWTRIIHDYGYVDDDTPSLSISILPKYRNRGIGTALLNKLLSSLKQRGYKQVSLSVQKANYAVGIYVKLGFSVLRENEEDYVMLCTL